MSQKIRTLSLIVVPDGEPIYNESATTVSIQDDAAGEFVVISQCGVEFCGKVAIDPSEWPALREAIDRMVAECRL